MKRFRAGELPLAELLAELLAHRWWVPYEGSVAQAQYADDVGFILCYSREGMNEDHRRWRQLDGAALVGELREDPEVGVVFDYDFPWAVHIRPQNTPDLAAALGSPRRG
ncbi:MAG: hypothetical protein R3A79_16765 [Nannocystaceae bacterium]